jgi:hypothetical protein
LEEEDVEENHMSQNAVTTSSASMEKYSNPPSSSETTKATSNTQKTPSHHRHVTPSTPPPKLDYIFLEDLKRKNANISLFELMKLPHIQDNFIKTLQGIASKNTKEANVGAVKGKGKVN